MVAGILFKPEMSLAIREDRKDVTRRLDHLQEINKEPDKWYFAGMEYLQYGGYQAHFESSKYGTKFIRPRYHAGQNVYVKEAHYAFGEYKMLKRKVKSGRHAVRFSHTGNGIYFLDNAPKDLLTETMGSDAICDVDMWYLRSPLFLEATHARTFLKILGVSYHRLQEITNYEAFREGMSKSIATRLGLSAPESQEEFDLTGTRRTFQVYWDEINPDMPFSFNPWCARYELKRINKPIKVE
jgi:hypothetical protein